MIWRQASDDVVWSITSLGNYVLDKMIIDVFKRAEIDNVGISLLGGELVNIEKITSSYKTQVIDINSGDLPDLNWNMRRVRYDWEMVNRDRPRWFNPNPIAWSKYLMMTVFQFTVWRLYGGIRRRCKLEKNIELLYENTSQVGHRQWLRWDSRSLLESHEALSQMNRKLSNKGLSRAGIAIEYYPESYELREYLPFLQLMRKKYRNLKFYVSFDPVHYIRANDFYPRMNQFTPEEYFYYMVSDRAISTKLRMMEISNIHQGGKVAHTSLQGMVNNNYIFGILGGALRKDLLIKPFHVVFELGPLMLLNFFRNGESYLKELKYFLNSQEKYQDICMEIKSRANYAKIKSVFEN